MFVHRSVIMFTGEVSVQWGSLSGGSVQSRRGVSVQEGGLCLGGLCPGRISVQRGLWGSLQRGGSLSRGSRRKVQKLRDQSQYISKKVRALQYWRWACGTCCKQYHMLFYIQMAVVSTAIFFLFSPSFSFFLEIKVQIYIYFHNKCQYINQTLQNLKFTELRRNQYPPSPCPQGYYTSYTLKCH